MKGKELVVGIKSALDEVTKAVVLAMNELRMSMNERMAVIAKAKRELAEDNETLMGISIAVNDFVEDMTEIAANMEEVTNVAGNILYDLDIIPDEIVISCEDDDISEDFDEEDAVDEIAE